MRRQKAEASKREQEWRKLEEEHSQCVTEIKRVNKEQCDTGCFLLLQIFCSFAIMSLNFFVCMYYQLREELQQAEQTRGAEVDAMRKEVSQLTSELHQRDINIATLTGSTSSMERQLRVEVERAERRAAELKVQPFHTGRWLK